MVFTLAGLKMLSQLLNMIIGCEIILKNNQVSEEVVITDDEINTVFNNPDKMYKESELDNDPGKQKLCDGVAEIRGTHMVDSIAFSEMNRQFSGKITTGIEKLPVNNISTQIKVYRESDLDNLVGTALKIQADSDAELNTIKNGEQILLDSIEVLTKPNVQELLELNATGRQNDDGMNEYFQLRSIECQEHVKEDSGANFDMVSLIILDNENNTIQKCV